MSELRCRCLDVGIGDSVSDIEVARAADVRSIGYATTQQRGTELREAGADAVIESMSRLVRTGDLN